MNDLDNQIRRAFDELVNAAPPPPSGPSLRVSTVDHSDPRGPRLFAVAASVVLVVAVGIIMFTQRTGGTQTLSTPSSKPATTEMVTTLVPQSTPPPETTLVPETTPEPETIRVETGGSPEPVTSVELAASGGYQPIPAPLLPGTTEPVPAPGDEYDGVYFAYLHEGVGPDDPRQLRFDVVQAFSGSDCTTRFGSDSASVCTPFGTDVDAVVGQVDVTVSEIPISVRDITSESSYSISGMELVALINGETPSPSAPDGFFYSGGFFLLAFENGTLTRLDQPGAK